MGICLDCCPSLNLKTLFILTSVWFSWSLCLVSFCRALVSRLLVLCCSLPGVSFMRLLKGPARLCLRVVKGTRDTQ